MLRLVQLQPKKSRDSRRYVAMVDDAELVLLFGYESVHSLALDALRFGKSLTSTAKAAAKGIRIRYDEVYEGRGDFALLPAFDHPDQTRCLVSGTGLTHKASVLNRNAMHAKPEHVTDSMRMFQWGLDGGKPKAGTIGASPEWFYKGSGAVLRAHGEPLTVPWFAEDGGEEPEIAGAYVIADDGTPVRVGFMQGNEFSDHKFEKRNYLYLASSKLRCCSVGPELIVGMTRFKDVKGKVAIDRKGKEIWAKSIATGETNMCHSVANMEHHHFKFPEHRRPGDAHVHFYGADAFSFGDGLTLKQGDRMSVSFDGFGRPLQNPVKIEQPSDKPIGVKALS